jgi:hypothetical protein
VQYISRPAATDTDVVDFSSVVGDTARMRVVHSAFSTSSGTNFQFVDRPQGVDLMSGKVTVEGFAGLTGPSGVGVIGAVIDTRVEIVGLQQMIDAILGKTTLTLAQTVGADVNGDGDLDMADVVAIINAQ